MNDIILYKENFDDNIELNYQQFQPKNYQLYAEQIFNLFSDKLRWFILDFVPGSGKTLTALNILKNIGGRYIIVGNEASQNSFQKEIELIGVDLSDYKFITIQKASQLQEADMIDFFSDSYIIIDEFQKLYSRQGLNSYGETFKTLFKHQLHRCKIIALTGTMFNATVEEIRYILDIFQEPTIKDFGESLTKDQLTQCAKLLSQHIITWTIQNEYFFAKKVLQGNNKLIKEFPLIRCEMSQKHYEAYQESTKNDQSLLANTKYLLPKYYYDGKQHLANEILEGGEVDKTNLKKYAPMSYFFIDKLQEILKKEKLKKSCAYIDNINAQFGLLQQMEILNQNGFILYGKRAQSNTLCSICGKTLQDHGKKDIFHYKPAAYGIYSNNISVQQRDYYKNIYNNYDNKHGHDMCLLIITQIAQTGLSLFSVSHFFVLDNIPEISLWEQIVARGIRYAGHMDLEPDERIINVYTLVPSAPGLKGITKHEQKWIDICEEERQIQELYEKIRNQSYNANNLMGKQPKLKVQIPFADNNIRYQIIQYIKQLDIQAIPLNELLGILRNDKLVPFGFSMKNMSDDYLQQIIEYIYTVKDNICMMEVFDDYNYFYRARVIQYPPIMYNKVSSVQTTSSLENDIFTQLNQTNNTNHLNYFIKIYISQGIDLWDEFLQKKTFAAYMIWSNLFYIPGDETQYAKNHLHLFSQIYDKDIYYIKDNIEKIINKYNITGYYQNNVVIKKDRATRIKTLNKYNLGDNLVQMFITNTLPDFKIIIKNSSYNCMVQQPNFWEIFKHEELFKQQQYEDQIQVYKCRYILYYALYEGKIQTPEFVVKTKASNM